MCCTTGRHHHGRRGQHHLCACGGHTPQHFQRRFMTQKQQIARLEEYLKDLQEEAKAVEEHIDELKPKK